MGYRNIEIEEFIRAIEQKDTPVYSIDVDQWSESVCEAIYDCPKASKCAPVADSDPNPLARWKRLLRQENSREMWKAIRWSGEVHVAPTHTNDQERPTDEDFKCHFEQLLWSTETVTTERLDDSATCVRIPVLDDEVSPMEVDHCIRSLKTDKATGPDGVAPGLFRHLPAQWIILIAQILNMVLISGSYPRLGVFQSFV